MKVKQIKVRCFEIVIDDQEEFFEFIRAHEDLVRPYLLLLFGRFDTAIDTYLSQERFVYLWCDDENRLHTIAANKNAAIEPSALSLSSKALILRRTIRSGERIEHDGDALIFGRVNSGAELIIGGSCAVFAPLSGALNCEGKCAVIDSVNKGGLFIFHGAVYERLEGQKRFFWENETVVMEDFK
ncbi:MAG: hypothetical protein LBN32_05110 [Helicobacteraceae bacterium]|jgi:hypothetical protein|nr:hypothetical protein [Helicobacteraceae bacterium]